MSVFEEFVRQFARNGRVAGRWDLGRERPALGGLLLLRQELELLAEMAGVSNIELTFVTDAEAGFVIPSVVRTAFSSYWSVHFNVGSAPDPAWPPTAAITAPHFSYQFFDRISVLASAFGHPPILRWAPDVIEAANAIRNRFPGKLIVLHLKNVSGQTEADSNAVFAHWLAFLATRAAPGSMDFLILGGDAVPDEVPGIAGVHSAQRSGIPLAVQLALASFADGFLGMASGICPAAVLSKVPYVLFKHPSHHVEEMRRELGSGDRFAFAQPRQLVWRMLHTPDMLERALNTVLGDEA